MAVTRKCHIVRIFSRDRDGTKDPSAFIDVLRTDMLFISAKDQHGWQQVKWKVDWGENKDEVDGELNNNPARKTHTLKIFDPENPPDDPLDPDDWCPVEVIDECFIRGWAGAFFRLKGKDVHLQYHQDTRLKFLNDWDGVRLADTTRKLRNSRIKNHTTTVDSQLNDPNGNTTKVDADQYQLNSGDDDSDGSYIEEELIKQYFNRWHIQQVSLANVFLTDPDDSDSMLNQIGLQLEDATGFNDGGDTIIPYRLDPFQTIVNVSLGGLAVEFYDGAS